MFRIITGVALVIGGLVLLYFSVVESLILLIHAGVVGGLGIAILFNKSEDAIEEINNDKVNNEHE